MPTDEKFIEWLRKIKEYCEKQCNCSNCPFSIKEKNEYDVEVDSCQVETLAFNLYIEPPNDWDMEEIERIIRL